MPHLPPNALGLAAVVVLAFSLEGGLGFGGTVVAVALGTWMLPIGKLLAAFLPLNVVLSGFVVATDRRRVAWRALLRDLVPKMALGMPIGFVLVRVLPERATLRAFGVFVIALALREIVVRARPTTSPPARPRVRAALLVLAGVLHGGFGVGGPLAVYVASRDFEQKSTFRSTLSALWLILNVALVTTFALRGTIDRQTLGTIVVLLPATALGIALGSVFHRAVPETMFRRLVLAMLIVMGLFRVVAG